MKLFRKQKKGLVYQEILKFLVQIDGYIPKHKLIPKFLNFQLELLLKYVIAFSGAIGILNLVPCFALDGQHILAAILLNKNSKYYITSEQSAQSIFLYSCIMYFGTSLLFVNLALGLISLFT